MSTEQNPTDDESTAEADPPSTAGDADPTSDGASEGTDAESGAGGGPDGTPADPESSAADVEDAGTEAADDETGADAAEAEVRTYQRFSCATEDLTDDALTAARTALDAGEVIVLPTDTVYGIGADAFNAEAVQRLLEAKGRGRDMPPPVLVAEAALIRALAVDVPDAVFALVELHWPGPLTVICKAQPSLRMDLGETAGTVALRVPDHDVARALLRRTGPMAVSSANLTGHDAALSADEAIDQLGNAVAVYLDAGSTPGNVPSTIVDFSTADHGVVVREGVLSVGALQDTVPDLRHRDDLAADEEDDADAIAAEIDAAAGTVPDPEPTDPEATDPEATDPEPTDPEVSDSEESDTGGADR